MNEPKTKRSAGIRTAQGASGASILASEPSKSASFRAFIPFYSLAVRNLGDSVVGGHGARYEAN